jgi:hypothetical protein
MYEGTKINLFFAKIAKLKNIFCKNPQKAPAVREKVAKIANLRQATVNFLRFLQLLEKAVAKSVLTSF